MFARPEHSRRPVFTSKDQRNWNISQFRCFEVRREQCKYQDVSNRNFGRGGGGAAVQPAHSCSASQAFTLACDTMTPPRTPNTSPKHRRRFVLVFFFLGATAHQRPRRARGFICAFKLGVTGRVRPPGEARRDASDTGNISSHRPPHPTPLPSGAVSELTRKICLFYAKKREAQAQTPLFICIFGLFFPHKFAG